MHMHNHTHTHTARRGKEVSQPNNTDPQLLLGPQIGDARLLLRSTDVLFGALLARRLFKRFTLVSFLLYFVELPGFVGLDVGTHPHTGTQIQQ